jgi:two-component system alkaline phosphatase synthesis response regulator PhoP
VVVGQEAESLRSLVQVLRDGGHTVDVVYPAEEPAAGLQQRPDAVIFDHTSGLTRSALTAFLEAAGLDERVVTLLALPLDRQVDLDLGVDDFVVWPGWPAEVRVRLQRALWRRNGTDPSHVIQAGDLVIDTANYRVYVAGQPVALRYKEYELLRYLAMNPNRVLTRETLLNGVWGYDYFGGVRTVDVHIRRLRSRIEDRHRTFIETVRNVGYRFRTGGDPAPGVAPPQTAE